MKRLERLLLAKQLIITEMTLLAAAMLVFYFVPQSAKAPSGTLGTLLHALAFDHVLSAWWVYALLLLVAASLATATLRFGRIAFRRTFRPEPPASRGDRVADVAVAEAVLRHAGYLHVGGSHEARRFVKNPWGYWGGVVLHAGMLLTLASVVVFILTDSMGTAAVMVGSTLRPGDAWDAQQPSILHGALRLPFAVTVNAVRDTYWSNNDLQQLATTASIESSSAPAEPLDIWINHIAVRHGITIYQGTKYGRAFLVELTAQGQTLRQALLLPQPSSPTKAGYADFTLPGTSDVLRAKYYSSRQKNAMVSDDPLLVLRLQSEGHPVGQVELTKTASATLGPYAVRLVAVTPWVELVFVRHQGIVGVFAGFLVILIGSVLLYFAPAREAWLVTSADGSTVVWRSHRFARMFDDEKRRLSELMRQSGEEDS